MDFSYSLPHEEYPGLFEAVQLAGIFDDSKTFVDCIPKFDPARIASKYQDQKDLPEFSLEKFVSTHFEVPSHAGRTPESDTSIPTSKHIRNLWKHLRREGSKQDGAGTLIPLRHPYVVPGGRFREIYYWDSYFTMLGLSLSGRVQLIGSMVQNFADQIDLVGHIPNGNRTYFLSRSQPPFFSMMIELLAAHRGRPVYEQYLPQLRKEYAYWMQSPRLVDLGDGLALNRYHDDLDIPRPESYAEDFHLTKDMDDQNKRQVLRDIRAACASGWDFSSRWLAKADDLKTIRTTEILPVDLNCLLLHYEKLFHSIYKRKRDEAEQAYFAEAGEKRKKAIQKYFWNEREGVFYDYLPAGKQQTNILSMATMFPLFVPVATKGQADRVVDRTIRSLLQPGGWMTTATISGQQWDAPNGWAPLQWIAFRGLLNYDHHETAREGAKRWLELNDRVFRETGKMLEKYDVADLSLSAGGGEYPVQDGFGWTNGVYLALQDALQNNGRPWKG